MSPAARLAVSAAFPALIVGCAALLVAGAAGVRIGAPWLVLAALLLAASAVAGAALAAVAFLRRDVWWGVGLVLAWPVLVPAYLEVLRRRSEQPEV